MRKGGRLTERECSVGIVGGGILGMTLALRLARQGLAATVMEGATSPGGLAAPHRLGTHTWDKFYHVILQSDRHLRALLEEIGLGDRLLWKQTRTGFFTGGRLVSLSNSLEFLRFPPLSLVGKARLALTILRAARITDGRALEKVPVVDWLERWSGRRTVERVWLPLLKSKLGDNYRITSAAFIWAVIARLYAARRSGLKVEMFGYVDGGYEVILRRLRDVLDQRGVEVVTGRPVVAVRDNGDGVEVSFGDGGSRTFDYLVVTVPAGRVSALCPQLSADEHERLRRVVYQGVVCASLLLRRPLGGYYVTNITDDGFPFTGVIEMTALVDRARFGNDTLVYLPRYLAQSDPFWGASDEEVREQFVAGLVRMFPDVRADDVVDFRVARARDVLALATLRYSEVALPPLRTSLSHVFVVNSAQIASGTLNNNEIVALVDRQVPELVRHLRPIRATSAA